RENEARAELRRSLNEANEKLRERKEEDREQKKSSRPVRAGDTVEILSMGVTASVITVSEDRVLTLQAGIIKTTAREDEVYLIEEKVTSKPAVSSKSNVALRTASTSSEIDLRGMMTDEAIPVLERYIDSAVMAKLEKLTIIHGKGTGALREAVSQSLKTNKAVKSYRLGRFGEGETGVTIVELR
ncbi:MAG: Smr/MutS family protein, partial [Oscillospiraceae bacterium]